MMVVRKVAADALAALVTATTFLVWLETGGDPDWRGWLAVIVPAVAGTIVAYLTPSGPGDGSPWWPIRKVGAAVVARLAASAAFLAWIGGTGDLDWRQITGIAAAALVPTLTGYMVPAAAVPPGGTPSAIDFDLDA